MMLRYPRAAQFAPGLLQQCNLHVCFEACAECVSVILIDAFTHLEASRKRMVPKHVANFSQNLCSSSAVLQIVAHSRSTCHSQISLGVDSPHLHTMAFIKRCLSCDE